jgi:signal peptidase I
LIRRLTAATVLYAVLMAGCATAPDVPVEHRYGFVVVHGSSMLPNIVPGYMLVDYGAPFSALKRGDVVVYRSTLLNISIIHRLVAKRGSGWVAKGDNNQTYDREWVTRVNYAAKAIMSPADMP